MGLALGIDYSLFVLSRYREERQAGRDKVDAIVATGGTSSKAVLFSGTSFVVALLGLLLVPDTILRSLALGAIIVGLVTMAAAAHPAARAAVAARRPGQRAAAALRRPRPPRREPVLDPSRQRRGPPPGDVPHRRRAGPPRGRLPGARPLPPAPPGSPRSPTTPTPRPAPSRSSGASPGVSTTDPAQVVVSGDVTSGEVTAAIARFEASVADDPDFGRSAAAGRRERPRRGDQRPAGRGPRPRPGAPRPRPAADRPGPRRVRRHRHQRPGRWGHGRERRLLRRDQQVAAARARLRPRA